MVAVSVAFLAALKVFAWRGTLSRLGNSQPEFFKLRNCALAYCLSVRARRTYDKDNAVCVFVLTQITT